MSTGRRALRTAALALALGLLSGCSDGGGRARGPENRCESAGDCPSGAECDPELDRCVLPGLAEGRVYYLKVTPPGGSGIPEQIFRVTLDVRGNALEKAVVYRPAAPVIEQVTGPDGKAIRAHVVFAETGARLPGAPERIAAVTSVEDRTFNARLLPGAARYSMAVTPEGEALGTLLPRYLDGVEATVSGGLVDRDGNRVSFEVEAASVWVSGTVGRGTQPIDGLTVEAVDPATGRRISTRGVTGCPTAEGAAPGGDAVCGSFTVGLGPGPAAYALRIYREGEPWYPAVTLPGLGFDAGTGTPDAPVSVSLGALDLGEPLAAPVRYRARVQRPVVLKNGEAVQDALAGCEVALESDAIGGGSAVRRGTTDEIGALTDGAGVDGIDLFPGSYRITVVPPIPLDDRAGDYAVLVSEAEVGEDPDGGADPPVFALARRLRLAGRVSAGDAPLPGGFVRALPLADPPTPMRPAAAAIGPDGAFALALDETSYRLVAEVPDGIGYAFGVADVDAGGACDAGDGGSCAIEIALPLPFAARAEIVLRDPDTLADSPLAGASVEWYEPLGAGDAVLVGRSASDENGWTRVLLPAVP